MTTDKFKSAAKSTGSALLTGLTVVANVSTHTRITEIEREMETLQEQMDQLQEERDQLEGRLIRR